MPQMIDYYTRHYGNIMNNKEINHVVYRNRFQNLQNMDILLEIYKYLKPA